MSRYVITFTVEATAGPFQNLDPESFAAHFLPVAWPASAKARIVGSAVTREDSPNPNRKAQP